MCITRHPWIWNLTVGFKECNKRLILEIYRQNQIVGFRERRGQSLVKVGQTRSNLTNGPETTRLCEIHIRILIIRIQNYGDVMVLVKFENNWMIRLCKHSHKGTSHMSITRHPYIWILTIGFEECNERIIQVNYDLNQMVGFRERERRDQILGKVGQFRLNLIDGLETTRLCEIQIRILIIGIER